MDVSNILTQQATALHRLSCGYRLFLENCIRISQKSTFLLLLSTVLPPLPYYRFTPITLRNVAGPSSLDLEANSGDKSRPGTLMGSPDSCDKRPSVRPPAPVSHVSRLARAPQADPLNRTSTINYPSTRRCPVSLISHPCVSQLGTVNVFRETFWNSF